MLNEQGRSLLDLLLQPGKNKTYPAIYECLTNINVHLRQLSIHSSTAKFADTISHNKPTFLLLSRPTPVRGLTLLLIQLHMVFDKEQK